MGKAPLAVKSRAPGSFLKAAKLGAKETTLTYNHYEHFDIKSTKGFLSGTDRVFSGQAQNRRSSAGFLLCHGTRMTDPPTSTEPGHQAVVAQYVASMSGDLAAMARGSGLQTLGYLLEMVRLEAENVSRHAQNGR